MGRIEHVLRPGIVLLDVNETIFDLEKLRRVFVGLGLDGGALEWWFAIVLRDGFALAATADFADFPDLARGALDEVLSASNRETGAHAADVLLEGFGGLTPHPDVVEGLEQLARANVPAVALTNGNAHTTTRLFSLAGFDHLVARVISVSEVRLWKPRPEPYVHAASTLGVTTRTLALVAAHPWDLHGASRAGLATAWVNRHHRVYPSYFAPPSVSDYSFSAVISRLLELPTSHP